MRTELTLNERRLIARKTISSKTKMGWSMLLKLGHTHNTYDEFNIPKYVDEVDEYYKNNPIVFDVDTGLPIRPKRIDNKEIYFLQSDVRNKLTPIKNLIALLENGLMKGHIEIHPYIQEEITNCKKSIEYLSNNSI